MGPTRVLLADDHTIVRQGLAGILRAYQEFEVVAEAADGREAFEKALEASPSSCASARRPWTTTARG